MIRAYTASIHRCAGVFPGIALVGVIALAAQFVADRHGGPVLLYALLLGTMFSHLAGDAKCATGVAFSTRSLLRSGVALLGFQLSFADILVLGWGVAALVAFAVCGTLMAGWLMGRLLGLTHAHSLMSAGAVAICGASAAVALSAVLPADRRSGTNTAFTVMAVTLISTLAMIVYPLLAQWLSLDDQAAGIFFGAAIHDVAQVVGAGYMVSETAGDTATVVKLMRVAMLLPVILAVSLIFRTKTPQMRGSMLLPPFVLLFVVLVLINSVVRLPAVVTVSAGEVSSAFITMAVAALGVKTSFVHIAALGWRPLAAIVLQTLFLGVIVISWLGLRQTF